MMSSSSLRRSRTLIAALATILVIGLVAYFSVRNSAEPPASVNSSQQTPRTSTSARSATSSARDSSAKRDASNPATGAGITTDVTAAKFPFSAYQDAPAPEAKPSGAPVGSAFIHVPSANQRVIYEPNQLGEFPTVETRLNDTVGIRLALDNVKLGTPVRVVIMDGGTFPSKEGVSQVIPATDWSGVAFEYTTSGNRGSHRVIVQPQGQPSRILDFNANSETNS